MNGELALESIDADGQGQHEPQGGIHRLTGDGAQPKGLGATQSLGGDPLELLVLSHAVDIGRRGRKL